MGPMKMKDTDRELFETKSVWAAVLSLAIPSVIGQLILVIYNMADTFFVGLAGDDSMLGMTRCSRQSPCACPLLCFSAQSLICLA